VAVQIDQHQASAGSSRRGTRPPAAQG
jgi:hypothetical protein